MKLEYTITDDGRTVSTGTIYDPDPALVEVVRHGRMPTLDYSKLTAAEVALAFPGGDVAKPTAPTPEVAALQQLLEALANDATIRADICANHPDDPTGGFVVQIDDQETCPVWVGKTALQDAAAHVRAFVEGDKASPRPLDPNSFRGLLEECRGKLRECTSGNPTEANLIDAVDALAVIVERLITGRH